MNPAFEQTQDIDSLYPSKFLKAADLDGGPLRVAIAGITSEMVGEPGKEQAKTALHFVGMDRPLILNVTNKETLKSALGRNPQLWSGKVIELFPTETPFAGKIVPCLRLRVPAVQRVTAAAPLKVAADIF